jgi:hypothetical protein
MNQYQLLHALALQIAIALKGGKPGALINADTVKSVLKDYQREAAAIEAYLMGVKADDYQARFP